LLCKPSRDRVSRKPRAFMQNWTDIYGNPSTSLYGIARERKEKGTKRGNGQS
jgi:hypothetical protein